MGHRAQVSTSCIANHQGLAYHHIRRNLYTFRWLLGSVILSYSFIRGYLNLSGRGYDRISRVNNVLGVNPDLTRVFLLHTRHYSFLNNPIEFSGIHRDGPRARGHRWCTWGSNPTIIINYAWSSSSSIYYNTFGSWGIWRVWIPLT